MEFKGTKAKRKIEKWEKELEQHNKPLNGWCVPDDEPNIEKLILYFKDGKPVHGIDEMGNPFIATGKPMINYRPATDQEIQERLFDSEQCRQYIDADYECLTGWCREKGEFERFSLMNDGGVKITVSKGQNLICDKDGNWAEIKKEPTTEENEDFVKKSIIEKVDKENVFIVAVEKTSDGEYNIEIHHKHFTNIEAVGILEAVKKELI